MQLSAAAFIWALALCAVSVTAAEETITPLQSLLKGSNEFATELFKEISKEKQNENLICSATSAHVVLSMAAYGAEGVTSQQMHRSLHLPQNDTIAVLSFRNLMDDLNNVKDVTLEMANQISVAKGFKVKDDYKLLANYVYGAETSEIDTSKPEDAIKTINDWVDEKTHHKIPTILQSSDISESTRMVLLNAIYFKSKWAYEFNKNKTADLPFTKMNGQKINVPTMYARDYYNFGRLDDLKAEFVEIPYKNTELKMVIILPDEVDGLKNLEENLKSYNYSRMADVALERELHLYLPKFKIETSIDLSKPLKKLNFTSMFSNSANFGGISDEPLQVNKVMQKSYIEVNEEGSEAVTTSGIVIMVKSSFNYSFPRVFHVKRPFFFMIKKSEITLFQGHVVNPLL